MKKQPKDEYGSVGDPFLVIELCHSRGVGWQQIATCASLPGRDGTKISRWALGPAGVTADEMALVQADIAQLVATAVEAWCGVQAVLEL